MYAIAPCSIDATTLAGCVAVHRTLGNGKGAGVYAPTAPNTGGIAPYVTVVEAQSATIANPVSFMGGIGVDGNIGDAFLIPPASPMAGFPSTRLLLKLTSPPYQVPIPPPLLALLPKMWVLLMITRQLITGDLTNLFTTAYREGIMGPKQVTFSKSPGTRQHLNQPFLVTATIFRELTSSRWLHPPACGAIYTGAKVMELQQHFLYRAMR